MGRAFGGRGRLVRSVDELRSATRKFLENPAPTMLDVRISRSVITLPYRRIHYGQDE